MTAYKGEGGRSLTALASVSALPIAAWQNGVNLEQIIVHPCHVGVQQDDGRNGDDDVVVVVVVDEGKPGRRRRRRRKKRRTYHVQLEFADVLVSKSLCTLTGLGDLDDTHHVSLGAGYGYRSKRSNAEVGSEVIGSRGVGR